MNSQSEFISDYISAPLESWSVEDKKKFIFINYLPNLSVYQKISEKIIYYNENEEKEEKIFLLFPNMNFNKDGNDYYIFYNNNLGSLKNIYKFNLMSIINMNKNTINYYKNNLLDSIDSDKFNILDEKGLKKSSYILSWFLKDEPYQKSINFGEKLSKINSIIKKCSDDINTENIAYITITKDLEKFDITYISDKNYKRFNYLNVEKELQNLATSNQEDEKFIEELEKCLYKFRNIIKPRISIENIIDFCFVLNRTSDYLSRLERSLEDKYLELLQKMSRLRRKIDVALLEFRFIYSEMSKPILDIMIDRFKLLTDNDNLKSIFLEKGEIKNNFIKRIEESLENQKNKLKSRKDYNSDFINLLKLYNQLARRDYKNRDDFFGIIIEEKKIVDNLKKNGKDEKSEQIDLREYIIYEINNEKDEINEIYDF